MYDETIKTLNPIGGTSSVDDSVLDEPYSYSMALAGHFRSGQHHQLVKVRLFGTMLKDQRRHYVVYLPEYGGLVGHGRQITPWIYIHDMVSAVVHIFRSL